MPNKFGMGWNVSDILGGLGDAISVGAGGESNYLNQIQRDRYGAGLDQFLGGDTAGGLKSLASAGGPTAANQWYDNWETNVNRAGQVLNAAEDNRRQAQVEADKRDLATEQRLAMMFQGATEQDWDARRQLAEQYAAQRGFDIGRANIPAKFKPNWSTEYGQSLMDPEKYYQQAETRRHNLATEDRQERQLQANTKLAGGRLIQQGIATDRRTDAANQASRDRRAAEAGRDRRAATAEAGRNARSKNTGGQTIDGYNLRPGKRVGGTATLPSGKVVTWDGTKWK